MKRIVVWIVVGLALLALVVGDLAPSIAAELVPPPTAASVGTVAVPPVTVRLAQAQQQPRRRTLMDMLFGGFNSQPRQTVQQPRPPQHTTPRAPPKPSLPTPSKPEIAKSPTATRLAVMGDSLAVDVSSALERLYADDPNLLVVPMGVGSSSFVRPDFFDWNKTLSEQIAKNTFDLAVVIIGINDRQTLKEDGESYKALTEGWIGAYKARVDAFVSQFRAANKPLIWIGLPPMQAQSYGQAISQIAQLQQLAVFGGGAEYVDIYDRFLDENGAYSSFGPDLNGQRVRMRKDDGIHFTAAGADKVAFYVNQTIKLFYRAGGGLGYEGADPLNGTDAQLMVRPPYQGLGEIRLLEVAGPVIPLTRTPQRAAELVTAGSAAGGDGFDTNLLIEAPIGRVDAFGVGRPPQTDESAAGQ